MMLSVILLIFGVVVFLEVIVRSRLYIQQPPVASPPPRRAAAAFFPVFFIGSFFVPSLSGVDPLAVGPLRPYGHDKPPRRFIPCLPRVLLLVFHRRAVRVVLMAIHLGEI
jgi:hypothetical protein